MCIFKEKEKEEIWAYILIAGLLLLNCILLNGIIDNKRMIFKLENFPTYLDLRITNFMNNRSIGMIEAPDGEDLVFFIEVNQTQRETFYLNGVYWILYMNEINYDYHDGNFEPINISLNYQSGTRMVCNIILYENYAASYIDIFFFEEKNGVLELS